MSYINEKSWFSPENENKWQSFLTQPFGVGAVDSFLGNFWDTHIGREGILGHAWDWVSLGESGTAADKRRKAKSSAEAYADRVKEHRDLIPLKEAEMFNLGGVQTANEMAGLLGNINAGTLAGDTSRTLRINKVIQDSILNRTKEFKESMERANDKMATAGDRLFVAENKIKEYS